MEQTSHHRDTEAQRTEKKRAFLCASAVNPEFESWRATSKVRVRDSGLGRRANPHFSPRVWKGGLKPLRSCSCESGVFALDTRLGMWYLVDGEEQDSGFRIQESE